MNDTQIEKINALIKCTFLPGSYAKRFVRDIHSVAAYKPETELTEKQAAYLDKLLHMYRKQIPVSHKRLCSLCPTPLPND